MPRSSRINDRLSSPLKAKRTALRVNLQYACTRAPGDHDAAHYCPPLADIQRWARTAASNHCGVITVRVVSAAESARLNQQYRGFNKPTNILSFPVDLPEILRNTPELAAEYPLGDLVIYAPLVASEALAQHKTLQAHWAHLIIHGTLHLIGYDHATASQAAQMEALEINILQRFNFANPYI